MFLGEVTCLIVYGIARRAGRVSGVRQEEDGRKFNIFMFWPASLCDMVATSLMYIGLNLTYASSFQMLRGTYLVLN